MVKEDIVEKEVVAAIEDLKDHIVDKTLKIKQSNIQSKIAKNYLIYRLNCHLYKVRQ